MSLEDDLEKVYKIHEDNMPLASTDALINIIVKLQSNKNYSAIDTLLSILDFSKVSDGHLTGALCFVFHEQEHQKNFLSFLDKVCSRFDEKSLKNSLRKRFDIRLGASNKQAKEARDKLYSLAKEW